MHLIGVVAFDQSRGIGYRGQLPWYIPEDLKHFKELTVGSIVVMGGVTARSIGKPLPNRKNWVITQDAESLPESFFKQPDFRTFASVIDFLKAVHQDVDDTAVYVIGGDSIYKQLNPYFAEVISTEIEAEFLTDTKFPPAVASETRSLLTEWSPTLTRPFWVRVYRSVRNPFLANM